MKKYDYRKVEKYWQKYWLENNTYSTDFNSGKIKFYNLWMFPYPSAEGLHAGHAFASTGSDVYGRFMRMNRKNVFQPIGYDSFGIHSENFALKIKEYPGDMLDRTTKHYGDQLKALGHGYDWTRTVTTSEIGYYRWTEWLFLKMFKSGLAYRKKSSVNWCPSCKTVLADEQVTSGKCERCGTEVEIKELEQWFFRITDYAERLLGGHKDINWSEKVINAQKNWIGKSEGAVIKFPIPETKNSISVFTTRPDTLYGATFLVISPEHPELKPLTTPEHIKEIHKYINNAKQKTKEDRINNKGEKSGIFTGSFVVNPANNKKIPVYVADYVLMGYGTGAIMAVPAHDERDWEFAKKYNLDIFEVVSGGDILKEAYTGSGILVNSGQWNGINAPGDMDKILKDIEKKGFGKKLRIYHLRDWLISRQRYWGTPIPMVYCEKCAKEGRGWLKNSDESKGHKSKILHNNQNDWNSAGWYPEENLPVILPTISDYQPEGKGRGPLAKHPEFYKVKCPVCGSDATRETDVSDTFLDSSWYFLRYPSIETQNLKVKSQKIDIRDQDLPWNSEITKKWLPVDLYFGGAEHSVLHLMYSRFVTMVLHDLGLLDFNEPFPRFFAHGLMIKDGAKMSKSRGNVVNPDEYIEKFGADTLRLYLMFMGPMDGYPDFRDTGIEGMRKFTDRIWNLFQEPNVNSPSNIEISIDADIEKNLRIKMHQTIKKVTDDIENFRYNTALSSIMIFVNYLDDICSDFVTQRRLKVNLRDWKEALKTLTLLLAPFAPHITEELWHSIFGNKTSIHFANWPKYKPDLIIEDNITIAVQINGKLRGTIQLKTHNSKLKTEVIKIAKENKKIGRYLEGKVIKNEIFVPGKLVNFVVN